MDQVNIEEMLCNRRCVRILDHIKNTPLAGVEAKCRYVFSDVLKKHHDALERILVHALDPSAPKNHVSTHGTQLGLCAAMVVTAKYANTSLLKWQFLKLDELQAQIESMLSQGNALRWPVCYISSVSLTGFPYGQGSYLAGAILGSRSGGNLFGELLMSVIRDSYVPDRRALLNILTLRALHSETLSKSVNEICKDLEKKGASGRKLEWPYHCVRYSAPYGRHSYRYVEGSD